MCGTQYTLLYWKEEKEVIKSRAVTYETCPLSISTHPCFAPACPHPSTARAPSRPPAAGGWWVKLALPSFQYVSREKDPHTASHHIQLNWTLPNPSEVSLQTARCYFTARRRWDKKSQVQQRNIDLFIPPSHSKIFTTTTALKTLSSFSWNPIWTQETCVTMRVVVENSMARCQKRYRHTATPPESSGGPCYSLPFLSSSEAPGRSFCWYENSR